MVSLYVCCSGRLECECAVRLRKVGLSRRQHRVVGGAIFGRRVAGCSAQCFARCSSRQVLTRGRQMARSRLSGEYQSAPWRCRDVKVSNDVTPFGSLRKCYSFAVADKFYSLAVPTTVTPWMLAGHCRLGVEPESSLEASSPTFPSCFLLPSWLFLSRCFFTCGEHRLITSLGKCPLFVQIFAGQPALPLVSCRIW